MRRCLGDLVDEHPRVGTLLLAVSGGPDSTALALAGIDVGERLGLRLEGLVVDHGLRPGSDAEAEAVRARLREWGARAEVARVDVNSIRGLGPEGAAREARMEALRGRAHDLAAENGSEVAILLGHTMDDQAETVLLRLAHGSGAATLRAMAPVRRLDAVTLAVRPLLAVRREDTHAMCAELGVEVVDDPTNRADGPWRAADGSALRRARVRETVLPALAEALGVDPVPGLARTALLAARDDDALDARAAQVSSVRTRFRAGRVRVGLTGLSDLPDAVLTRLVRHAALEAGVRGRDLTSAHVDSLLSLVRDGRGGRRITLPGVTAWREGRVGDGEIVLAPRPGE